MRQSQLFTKTRRDAPSDEVAKNAQLLTRAGFIHKEMAGVYSFLPLGLRTLNNIMEVIREEMNAIGGQEVMLSTLQDSAHWEKSGRWSDEVVDVWFKTKNQAGNELGLAPTHEEPLTSIMSGHIASYKDVPQYVYQFQNKFRNEVRAKSGIMRTREFIMKDLYSFNRDEDSFREFYEKAAAAYLQIFKRLGISDKTYRTFASGGSFSKFSDEFQTICDAGEDIIYIHDEKGIAVNEEVYTDEVLAELGMKKEDMREAKAAEVGNIFPLGTKYSEALGLTFKDEEGSETPVYMGSYGIGPARLMGVIVELLSDEKGMVWPEEVAPFPVHLVSLAGDNAEVKKEAEHVYEQLTDHGIEVLFDDRDLRPGEKFADADLIGIPLRLVISEKSMEQGGIEATERVDGSTKIVPESELLEFLKR